MKKPIFIILMGILLRANSQIPNASFENWLDMTTCPGWFIAPSGKIQKQVAYSHSGNSAMWSGVFQDPNNSKLSTGPFWTNYSPSPLNRYVPISLKPSSLYGWFIFEGFGFDTMGIEISLKKNGSVIGQGEFVTANSYSTYTQFSVEITYSNTAVPDSMEITIGLRSAHQQASHLIIDDLSFDKDVGISEIISEYAGFDLFPNPSLGTIHIQHNKSTSKIEHKIEIRDGLGILIAEHQVANATDMELDLHSLTSGIYFVSVLEGPALVGTRKLVIMN